MNLKLPKSAGLITAVLLVVLHLVFIVFRGYFLSPEFTVYPFLTAHGFLPYANLIDQHFPALLFGPFSLPARLTVNPQPLLWLFLSLTAATDLLLFFSTSLVWLLLWIAASAWFSGNTLWFETFIVLLFSLILFLRSSRRPLISLARGFLLGLLFLLKPALLPALAIFLILTGPFSLPFLLAGFLLPILVTALYLFKFQLPTAFFDLTVRFNREYYLPYAAKLPSLRQILEASAVFFPIAFVLVARRRFLAILLVIFAAVLAYPRFEYVHLLPALFLAIYALSQIKIKNTGPLFLFLAVLFVFTFVKAVGRGYGNFYLSAQTQKAALYLRGLPGTSLYLLGGSDLLYPLTDRVPPFFTYLPSLPWYLKNPNFAKRVVDALKISPGTPVLVDGSASVDGVNIQESSGPIWFYIKDNYQLVETIGNYRIYQRKGL